MLKILVIGGIVMLCAATARAESPYQRYIDQCNQTLPRPNGCSGSCSAERFAIAECVAGMVYPRSSPALRAECAQRADQERISAHLPLAYYSVDPVVRCVGGR